MYILVFLKVVNSKT